MERCENAKQELVSEAVATKQAAIFRFMLVVVTAALYVRLLSRCYQVLASHGFMTHEDEG